MELRNGKRLPPVPLNRVNRRKPQRFRLLDLPTELRLMIFGYVIGRHQNVYWTMTYESTPTSGYVLALGHVDDLNYIRRNANLHQRHLSLLHTCRQVSEEALSVFYSQTRFDIGFCQNDVFRYCTAYQLKLTHAGAKLSGGLAADVLQRVKHVRFSFSNERRRYTHIWLMHLLCFFLGHGAGLSSLQFVENCNDEDTWHAHHSILNFKFYRGNAVLEIHNANHADEEEIAKLKEASRSTCYSYSRHFHEKTLTSSQVLSIHFPLPCLTRAMFRVTRRISGPNLLVDARTTRWVLLNYTRIGTIAGV
jgi:hypothetical protein